VLSLKTTFEMATLLLYVHSWKRIFAWFKSPQMFKKKTKTKSCMVLERIHLEENSLRKLEFKKPVLPLELSGDEFLSSGSASRLMVLSGGSTYTHSIKLIKDFQPLSIGTKLSTRKL
jgi:hypothetical protein